MIRIRRLDLERFGHFTGRSIDFGPRREGQADFHLVHGPNEAGKTTLMEAWLRLLYGFDHRERYAFLHSPDALQVGGVLEIDGRETEFVRVKRRSASLLDAHRQPVPEAALLASLGGLGPEDYRSLLCLDDRTIEDGGEEILRSKGDIGALLFSAAAGVSAISQVLSIAGANAGRFHRKGASTTEYAELKRRHDEIVSLVKARDVTAARYRVLRADFEKAREEEERLRAERDSLRAEERRLAALVDAHHAAARLPAMLAELEPLEELPQSCDLDPERLVNLATEQAQLATIRDGAAVQAEALAAEAAKLALQPEMLSLAEPFAALEDLRGRAAGAIADLPKREAERHGLLREMKAELAEIGIEADDPVAFALPRHRYEALERCRDRLAAATSALGNAREEESAAVAEEEIVAQEAKAAAAAAKVPPELVRLLEAHRAVDLLRELENAAELVRRAEATARDSIKALRIEGSAFSALPSVSLSPQQAGEFAAGLSAAQMVLAEAQKAERDAGVRREAAAARLSRMTGVAEIPSEDEAREARQRRDKAWQAHRRSLDEGSADAFEAALREDDRLGLLRQAGAMRLAEIAEARLTLADEEAAHAQAADRLEEAKRELARLQGEHSARLAQAGLPADLDPFKFAEWLRRLGEARDAETALIEARNAAAPAQAAGAALKAALLKIEGFDAAAEADVLIRRALAMAREHEAQAARAAAAAQSLARARSALQRRRSLRADCETALQDARQAWERALDEAFPDRGGLPPLLDALPALGRLRDSKAGLASLDERIATMRRDLSDFETRIGQLVAPLEGYKGLPALETWRLLRDEIDAARKAEGRRADLERRRGEALATRDGAVDRLAQIDREVEALATAFPGLPEIDLASLRRAVAETRRAIALRERAGELRTRVVECLSATSFAQAQAALLETPLAQAQPLLDEAREALEEMDGTLDEAVSSRTTAAAELARVQGDGEIAALTAERKAIEARMEEGFLRWLEERFGQMLAERALHRYRDSHRSAMLEAAQTAFATLTAGAYDRLTTQSDGAAQTLVAIQARDGQSRLATQMSKGTRFQLYLALRAAAYEQMAANGVALPFFCDDIFETFDEQRTRAACGLMSQIGMKGQAIYLTHHAHVVEIARELCGDAVRVHSLGELVAAAQ